MPAGPGAHSPPQAGDWIYLARAVLDLAPRADAGPAAERVAQYLRGRAWWGAEGPWDEAECAAYYVLGRVFHRLGDRARALECFTKVQARGLPPAVRWIADDAAAIAAQLRSG